MTDPMIKVVVDALEDIKAVDITVLDVSDKTDVFDTIIIATGNSNRQVNALAANVVDEVKQRGIQPIGVEGREASEWVLVDLGDIVVHTMLPAIREFYALEKLWGDTPEAQVE
ncbi:ribosome silencing factor [uncultured Umboniibacter sp.]|uniref:ribosome silencing factor n=1 Tax=uncultured Umboniibacter sp. TaxID=1798917 RepID=UPI00260CE131|nr:ribosome silencing factor [uncultured Umboniibacter sp.]